MGLMDLLVRKDATAGDVHVATGLKRRRSDRFKDLLDAFMKEDVEKIGQRNNKRDQATVQLLHDATCALGADCYNEQVPSGAANDRSAMAYVKNDADWSADVEINKVDEDQCLVFGWASVVHKDGQAVVDHQGDTIDVHDLEKAVYVYVENSRDGGEMHQVLGKGVLVESVVMTVEKQRAMGLAEDSTHIGWWCGYRFDQDTFAKVKSGQYTMFSIGGSAVRQDVSSK